MKFDVIADYFEKIEQESARLVITRYLAELLLKANAQEAQIICNLSMGLLHPPYIGTQFQVAQKSMIPVVATLLNKDESDIVKAAKEAGDLGILVSHGSWIASKDLSVVNVYNHLSALEKIAGVGSQEKKGEAIAALCQALDPVSAKYVIRIIMGTLRLGFSDMTIIDALSWMQAGDKSLRSDIEDAYNMCADIGLIAYVLKEKGIAGIHAMRIKVGIPIRPAAAERLPTASAIIEKLGASIAQPKLDGFRLQIHLDKRGSTPLVSFFSRNLQDMSSMFPDLKEEVLNLHVETLICEGEAISYDPNTGSFLPFQETVKRKRKHGIDEVASEYPLKLYLFDLLYMDGTPLLDVAHHERREILEKMLHKSKHQNIQLIEEVSVSTAEQLEGYFLKNISAGLEGLVVKRDEACYQPGKRNFNWIKLKRQEEGHLEDTLDCVIVGYYSGRGKRASFGIGAFLVALYNPAEDRFETVAKIGTGLKDPEWVDLKKRCDEWAVNEQPRNVVCSKDLMPDVWVRPEIVCLVRADEITISPVHTAGKKNDQLGLALRFPRIMGYRPDKSASDATTVKELRALFNDQYARSK